MDNSPRPPSSSPSSSSSSNSSYARRSQSSSRSRHSNHNTSHSSRSHSASHSASPSPSTTRSLSSSSSSSSSSSTAQDYTDDESEGQDGYKPGGYNPVKPSDILCDVGLTPTLKSPSMVAAYDTEEKLKIPGVPGAKRCRKRYLILKKLGWGHFSTVWLCRALEDGDGDGDGGGGAATGDLESPYLSPLAEKAATSKSATSATPTQTPTPTPTPTSPEPNFDHSNLYAIKVQKSADHYTEAAIDEVDLLNSVYKNEVESGVGECLFLGSLPSLLSSTPNPSPPPLHTPHSTPHTPQNRTA